MRAGWSIKRRRRIAEPYHLLHKNYRALLRAYRQEVLINSIADALWLELIGTHGETL